MNGLVDPQRAVDIKIDNLEGDRRVGSRARSLQESLKPQQLAGFPNSSMSGEQFDTRFGWVGPPKTCRNTISRPDSARLAKVHEARVVRLQFVDIARAIESRDGWWRLAHRTLL